MEPFDLRGDGVLLTVPTSADVDIIAELCQDEDVQRWTTVPSPYRRRDAEAFISGYVRERWASGTELTWAIRNPEDRSVYGMIGISHDGFGSGEVGFWLGSRGRGRGLVTRAVRLVAEYAFAPEGMGLERLIWHAYVGNWGSRRVAWRLGFTFEGTIRSHLAQRGVRRDAWVATLMAGDPMEPRTRWLDVPTLAGSALTLRRWDESDADAVVEACTDPVTRHWLAGLPSPYTRDTALNYIRSREQDHATSDGVHWAAAPVDGGPAIGSFSLMGINQRLASAGAELGYWVHPAARGKGVASEAVRLLVRHAFTPESAGGLGLRRLVLAHAAGNDASARVARRAGFTEYGIEALAENLGDGTYADLHHYELLAPTDTSRPE